MRLRSKGKGRGHSSMKTTEIYTHVLEDIKSKEVDCLNNMYKNPNKL